MDDDEDDDDENNLSVQKVQFLLGAEKKKNQMYSVVLSKRDIVSYQRFGKLDKKFAIQAFKCHLCGFGCTYKETLLDHFADKHPN